MKKILTITSILVVAYSEVRIINGTNAIEGEFPWFVGISQTGYKPFCGASLIDREWVLTAGHCVYDSYSSDNTISTNSYVVNYGDRNFNQTKEIEIEKIILHESYNNYRTLNDIALIKLKTPIEDIEPIELISSSNLDDIGNIATVIGWGNTKYNSQTNVSYSQSEDLMKVDVPIVSNEICQNSYSGYGIVDENMFCAGYQEGGKDACQGDSGGPLIIQENGEYQQIGITSWGYGCAEPTYYGVYTKVENFKKWISKKISENSDVIELKKGWNLFSPPFKESKIKTLTQLKIYGYSPLDKVFFEPTQLDSWVGYWIKSDIDDIVQVKRESINKRINSPTDLSNYLYYGWNLIGAPYDISTDTLYELGAKIIWKFDSKAKRWELNPKTVSKSEGFWVKF